jgi:hypothetical protein
MNKISAELRQIAVSVRAFGFLFRQPSLSLAASNLLHLANEFEPEYQEDVRRIMEKGLPPVQSRSDVIKSNYLLEDADIFITMSVKFYDENDRPVELPDTLETQANLVNAQQHRMTALIVWPDVDMLVEYDPIDRRSDTSQSHGPGGQFVHPDDVGAANLDDVMTAAGPGSSVTNKKFKELAAMHGYQSKFLLDWY